MPNEARFWDRHAEGYAKRPVGDEESYQKKLAVTREYFRPDMEVLEFGCGTGSTAIAHAPYVKHIQAIDVSPKMLEIAQGKADAADVTNITFTVARIDDFEATDQTFDAVLGMSILHLVADRDGIIAKVHKLLKPGGIFVSSTICIGDGMGFLKFILPVGRAVGLLPLIRVFTEQDLAESITSAGFEIDYQWRPANGNAVFIVAKKAVPQ